MSGDIVFALLILPAVIVGLRGSIRLTIRFRRTSPQLVALERLLLGTLVAVAWLITTVGAWLVYASSRRIMGLAPLPGGALITLVGAEAILFIPGALDLVVTWIARSRGRK